MKKIVLSLLLLAGCFSYAFSQTSGTCGENLVWRLSDGTLTIRPVEGTTGGSMTNYSSSDRAPWYNGRSDISKVIIEKGVTSIGNYAFDGCSSLTSVTIPEGVTTIGGRAFGGCSGLTSVTIPEGVTTIEGAAFSECIGLTSVTIPEGVTTIGGGAFGECSGLASVTIPNSVNSIGDWAFVNCSGLTSVTIPESVTSIGECAFEGCSGLTSVTILEGVTSIGPFAFNICSSLTSVTIPNSVTSIGRAAFQGCSSLTSVTIPKSVTSIEGYTFYSCSGLTSVTIPEGVATIESDAFSRCGGLKEIINYRHDPISLNESSSPFGDLNVDEIRLVVPIGCVSAYEGAEVWRDFQVVEMLVAPEFSEKESVVTCGTGVSLSCASSNVVIYYGIGKDAEPTLLYEGGIAITITDTTYICALAQRGDEKSEVVRVTYFANHELDAHEGVAATCTEKGREAYWECGRCGKLFRDAEATTEIAEPVEIPASHDLTAHEAVAATCTEKGMEAYWECGRCGKLFRDAEATTEITEPVEIAATGHAYGQPVWIWTDDYQASITLTCTVCLHEEKPEVTVTSAITRPATTTEEGERVYLATASFEGETYRDTRTEVIPRLEDPTASSEVNVLAEGVKIYPNPSQGAFKVELPIDAQVEIFDASGKRVLAQTCSAGTHGLNLAQTGIYVLKVSAIGQQATFRLVVR